MDTPPVTKSAAREEFLATVVTTAVEGGIGYWSVVHKYDWWYPDLQGHTPAPSDGMAFTRASIELTEDADESHPAGRRVEVDHDTVRRGMLVLTSGERQVRRDIYEAIVLANHSSDGGEIDSEIADCIVQAGLFGRVIFG